MKKNKNVLLGLLIFISYLIFSFFGSDILNIFGINKYPTVIKLIIVLIYDLFILFSLVCVYLKNIRKDFKDFLTNLKYYLNNYLKYWFLNLGLMMITSSIISMITKIDNSTNQEYVVKILENFPIYALLSTVIIAPLTEELIFRLNFRKIFKTDILFIIISGLVFGIMHLSVASSFLELIYIIPYSIPGFIFAYTLKKSNNIFVPIFLHLLHNGVMMILQILITLI